jgi:phosphoribosyl 1,2-cyclic phosphodiesterase
MRVCLLASGSGGNSIYIQNGSSSVLIDAGLTGKRIEERLQGIGVDPSTLQGIVVSHEHSDHIKGVGILARRYHLPVWLTEGTLNASKKTFRGTEQIHVMDNDEDFSIGDLAFQAFQLPHDAADPVNFVVTDGNAQVAIATDMGVMTQLVYQRLREVDFVVIESNYDLKMLMDGPYPWDLKKRISGRHGHLPNDGAAETLCNLALEGLQQAVLAHLSEKNNHPDLARETCQDMLVHRGIRNFSITVAAQDRPGDIFVV